MEEVEELVNDGLDDLFVFVDHNQYESEKITAPRYSYWKSVWRVFFKKKSNWIFLGLLFILLVFTFIYPIFSAYDQFYMLNLYPDKVNTFQNLSPSDTMSSVVPLTGFHLRWILGTNEVSASVFDQLWSGTRTSLLLAFICTAINMSIGIILGAVWGLSKTFDAIMNQIYNIIGNIPTILFITILSYIIGSGFWQLVLALCITGWLGIAYFIRTQVIIIRDREYNLASRCLGTNVFTIVIRNILPFMVSIIVTILASELPGYISSEVFLSYLGIGLSGANTPSLGTMLEKATSSGVSSKPWQFWPPVIVAGIVSVVLYVVGQNVGDASDPRTHM